METKNSKYPVEYTIKVPAGGYRAGSFDSYKAGKIVEERIGKALDAAGIPDTVRRHCSFNIRIIDGFSTKDGKWFSTRVYAGGWTFRRGNNKGFIQSKRNESIDLDRAVEFIKGKAKELREYEMAYENRRMRERSSEEAAEALREEFTIEKYSGPVSVDYSATGSDIVKVKFEKELTVEEARKVLAILITI